MIFDVPVPQLRFLPLPWLFLKLGLPATHLIAPQRAQGIGLKMQINKIL